MTSESSVTMKQRGLRFDKVALRLVAQMQAELRDDVPIGKTVLVTVSAPIRLPGKTANALEERIRQWLTSPSNAAEFQETINGNRARVRLVIRTSSGTPNVLGFVHNPDVDTTALLSSVESALAAPSPPEGSPK